MGVKGDLHNTLNNREFKLKKKDVDRAQKKGILHIPVHSPNAEGIVFEKHFLVSPIHYVIYQAFQVFSPSSLSLNKPLILSIHKEIQ